MKTRDFLIVFLYNHPEKGITYHNCWVSIIGFFNQKGIEKAAEAAGLDPEKVTVICIQELDRE